MNRLRGERGAIAVLASICMIFITGAAALSIDVGKMSYGKRQVQSIADLVALDAVRAVGDRRDTTRDALAVAQEYALTSAQRNSFDPSEPGNGMTVELGIGDPNTRLYVPLPSGASAAPANAVRITVTTTLEHAFLPGQTSVTSAAIAVAGPAGATLVPPAPTPAPPGPSSTSSASPVPTPTSSSSANAEGGLSVGSYMARLDSSQAPLWNAIMGGMVGGDVSLSAASYAALANPNVTINVGDLLAELSVTVGSPDQVANGTVTLADVLAASAAVLSREGTVESAEAATAYQTMASSAEMGGLSLSIADILRVSGMSGSVASAEINALQLGVIAMEAANGSNLVAIDVPVTVPGVASITMKVAIIEPPAIAIGPPGVDSNGGWLTQAYTAQARITMTATLAQQFPVAGVNTTVTVPLFFDGGRATAALASIVCGAPSDSTAGVHGTADALHAYVGTVTDTQMMLDASQSPTPNVAVYAQVAGVAQVSGSGSYTLGGSAADMTFTWPYGATATPASQTFGATATNLLSSLSASVTANGVTLGGLVPASTSEVTAIRDAVRAALTGLADPLDDALAMLDLTSSDGATFGGADATNFQLSCPASATVSTPTPAPTETSSPAPGGATPTPSPASSVPASDVRKLIG